MAKIVSFEEKKILWNDNKIPHKGDKRREAKRRQRRIELNKAKLNGYNK